MTNKEFSNEFDILYNSISSNLAPSLNEYEKSVLLTRAQEELIKELVTGKNQLGESFDKDEEVRSYLHSLNRVKTGKLKDISTGTSKYPGANYKISYSALNTFIISDTGKSTTERYWYKTFVSFIYQNKNIPVIPITHDQLITALNNPFKKPNKRRALYIDTQDSFEIFASDIPDDANIYIGYIIKPTPIVLEDLSSYGVSIDGVNFKLSCEAPTILHYEILKRAVYLAMYSTGILQQTAQQ